MNITIVRGNKYAETTMGMMYIEGNPISLFTLERAWKDNHPQDSCIPIGTYTCIPHNWEENPTMKFSRVWEVTHVPNREAILIHSGNTFKDIHGCVLVGLESGHLEGVPAVLRSREAINILRKEIGEKEFTLVIK